MNEKQIPLFDAGDRRILAVLFAAGEPLELERLAEGLGVDKAAMRQTLERLRGRLREAGLPFELLELEESGADVATICIETVDDAYCFALNAYMLHMPVSFLSDSEEALEMALLMYNGCAFVDSRSNLDESILERLAKGYGAVVR